MKELEDPPGSCPLPPALVALLTQADRDIRRLEPENAYRLYEFLHVTARRIAPVDAFYVCLYSDSQQSLFFPYNVDGDVYDPPITLPLGNGPTSRVIRERRALVWNDADQARRVGGIMFGQTEQFSHSAMQVPIRGVGAGEPLILGVLSCHAYQPHSYPAEAVLAFQRLADRAGMALTRERDEVAWRYRMKAADAGEADHQRPLVAMADEFVVMLQGLEKQAEALHALLPAGGGALADAAGQLGQACREAQTRANQLPLRPDLSSRAQPDRRLARLTAAERTVLQHLAAGRSNREIAAELFVAEDTVKFHCKNVFHKLEVASRTAAARIWHASHPSADESYPNE